MNPDGRPRDCPDFEQLSLAASDAAPPGVLSHVDGCVTCRRLVTELRDLAALAKQIPRPTPSAEAAEAGEARLLTAVRGRDRVRARRRGIAIGVAAGALAAGLGGLVITRLTAEPPGSTPAVAAAPTPVTPATAGVPTIAATGEAKYAERVQLDEAGRAHTVIDLDDGALTIDVPRMPEARPLQLRVGQQIVRLDGARVRAVAIAGVLRRVEVLSGSVELPARRVEAGEVWTAAPEESAQELAFTAGFAALEQGDLQGAAAALERAAGAEGPLRQDAGFWWATAEIRAGDEVAAARAIEAYLARYEGPQAAELALVLASWRLRDGEAASALLGRAEAEGSAEVRARAADLRRAR